MGGKKLSTSNWMDHKNKQGTSL
uniref:Uncharacterized protein n=1 Tax=Arundo donax TaxID=35708 RepID=A0A0A9FIF9_ARUDO